MFDVKQTADKLCLAEVTLRKFLNMGLISCYRLNTKVVFSQQQIDDFLRSCESPTK
jgi:hypothetical protein